MYCVKGNTMKIIKETMWDRLFNRLPANDARKVTRVLKRAGCVATPDYLDVKAMSELVERYRDKTTRALEEFRRWQIQEGAQAMATVVRKREGELLRKRAMECASLYWDARRDYRDIVDIAMRPYMAANDER